MREAGQKAIRAGEEEKEAIKVIGLGNVTPRKRGLPTRVAPPRVGSEIEERSSSFFFAPLSCGVFSCPCACRAPKRALFVRGGFVSCGRGGEQDRRWGDLCLGIASGAE